MHGMMDDFAEMHVEIRKLKAENRELRERLGLPIHDSLLACPSCEKEKVEVVRVSGRHVANPFRIECKNCGLMVPAFETADDAAEKWNKLPRKKS